MTLPPLVILAIGVAVVLGMIVALRMNAFIALITAAMAVSLLAPGATAEKISRVADAFGAACGKIGIVIGLAAVIGKAMMDSGAADRIVRAFLRLLGEKRSPLALMASGYVLAVPVFFDTVFYLLVPLARSLYRRTHHNFLLYVCAIAAGGAVTHTLVPPTPGPLGMAANLKFDVGLMILVGALIAVPASFSGLVYARFIDRKLNLTMRPLGDEHDVEPLADERLPGLIPSLLPVVLPVLMISAHTITSTLAGAEGGSGRWTSLSQYTAILGNANLALLVATAIALFTYWRQRRPSLAKAAAAVESALMSGGVIILITAGGGAFGEMLKVAEIGEAIKGLFPANVGLGTTLLFLGFGLGSMLKFAQGSGTVAMVTGTAMLAGMLPEVGTAEMASQLGFHPVYLATAVGGGSMVGSWMNDSGFWIFAKMSGLTEVEALQSWLPMLSIMGGVTMVVTVILANVLPLL